MTKKPGFRGGLAAAPLAALLALALPTLAGAQGTVNAHKLDVAELEMHCSKYAESRGEVERRAELQRLVDAR